MRQSLVFVGLFLVGLLAWFLLERWVPRGSERFYLLLPPLFLAFYSLRSRNGWKELRPYVVPACGYVACLALFCTLYSLAMLFMMFPVLLGGVLRGLSLKEIVIAVYFLIALKLLLGGLWNTILRWVHSAHRWYFGSSLGQEPKRFTTKALLAQILPTVLMLPLILPYVLATLYVHRIKIPNVLTPQQYANRPYEEVELPTKDGLTIRGWFVPALKSPSARTLIICHGLGANRSNFLPFLQVADRIKANAFLFDFRGHGDSDGHTVSMGYWEKLDVEAAVYYLREHRTAQTQELIGLGISLGTSGLIRAAADVEPPFTALIIDSGIASVVELTENALQVFPAPLRPLLTAPGVPLASLEAGCWLPDVRPIDQVDRLRAPVLFIHAAGDKIIPVEHTRRLHDRALEPKRLWIAETDSHGGALFVAPTAYLEAVSSLVESVPGS